MSLETKLSTNQKKALSALLEHRTIKAAAIACGLAEKTLQRYLQQPAFQSALNAREDAMVKEAGRILLAGQPKALETLEYLMNNAKSENNKRMAAVAWLGFILDWRNLRLENRISRLEETVYEKIRKAR